MSINTHIRYTLSCDMCGLFYLGAEKFADSSVLEYCAKKDGWNISCNGHFSVYLCPDCAEKRRMQNE